MNNKLPELFSIDLYNLVADSESLVASIHKLPYTKENAYLVGVEIAAIGMVLAKGRDTELSNEALTKDVVTRAEEWSKKLDEAEAAHASGACGCGQSHDEETPESDPN